MSYMHVQGTGYPNLKRYKKAALKLAQKRRDTKRKRKEGGGKPAVRKKSVCLVITFLSFAHYRYTRYVTSC